MCVIPAQKRGCHILILYESRNKGSNGNAVRAKWNVPQAAKHCNLTNKEMKITFNEYCNFHDITYIPEDSAIQLSLQV